MKGRITIRFTKEEMQHLEQRAEQVDLPVATYIKAQLFDPQNAKDSSTTCKNIYVNDKKIDYEKLIKLLIDGYIHIKRLSSKTLNAEDYELIEKTFHEKIKLFILD